MAFGNFEFPNASVYDSDLREVLRIIRKLIDEYDTIVKSIEEISDVSDEVKKEVDQLKNDWNNISDTINSIIDDSLSDFEVKFEDKLTAALNILQTEIDNINTFVDNWKEYVDTRNEQTKIWVIKLISLEVAAINKEIDQLKDIIKNYNVYNPLRAKWQDVNKAVNDLYEAERYGGLSNAEMAHYDLTNEEWANRNLSNFDFAINLRWIMEDYGVRRTTHPLYGIKTTPYNSDSFLLTEFFGTMSNAQYIELDLTNNEYAALNLTNADYLKYNAKPPYLSQAVLDGMIDTNGTGLTNAQYGTLGIHV